MTGPQKAKGDRAEREACQMLTDLTGHTVTRRFGAGQALDTGDLTGLPDHTIQVADWKDLAQAIRVKPAECEQQQARAGSRFGVTFLRTRGGVWRACLTPSQWHDYARGCE